jgi:glycosyltransferase involved in cell wall biosynthesis/2-polyprenyl-3-methyl-5-hydroxy-6-metoxy-1,4-benzoquinol methylase/predicted  nucleic acid-binding Zn-ribbon protein
MNNLKKCLWCGMKEFKVVAKRKDSINVLECTNCGLKQLEKIPDELLRVYYDDEYFNGKTSNISDTVPSVGYHNYHEVLLHSFLWQQAFLKLITEESKGELLDVGCASGKFLELAEMAGFSPIGIDISPNAIRLAKIKGFAVFCGSLEQLQAENEKFDVITAWDFIEHIINPKEFFNECKRLLKPNGVLIFSTPDAGAKIVKEKGDQWIGYISSLEHLSFFTSEFLARAFKEVFQTEPQIYSFTYGEYSTIVGYIRKSRLTQHDKLIDSYLRNSAYPIDIQTESEKINLLSILYAHFDVDINKVQKMIELLELIAPNPKISFLKSLIYLKQGKYQEAIYLLQNLAKVNRRDSLIWQVLIEALRQESSNLWTPLKDKIDEITNLRGTMAGLESKIESKNIEVSQLHENLSDLKSQLKDKIDEVANLQGTMAGLESKIESKNIEVSQLHENLSDLESQLKDKIDEVANLQGTMTGLESKIESKNIEVSQLHENLSDLESQLKDKIDEVINLRGTMAGLESQIEIKNLEIGQLQETLRQRESSLSWRFSQFYGRYFSTDSRFTRFISYIINKIVPSSYKIQNEDTHTNKQKILVDHQQSKLKEDWKLNDIYFGETKGKISVVLPVYNQAYLLEESIQSVLNQTYKNFELIIVNDGSTDNIKPILDKYAHHQKVLILTQENQKLPKALTNGFLYASGEFYTWTSADNIMLPKQLEEQVKFLQKNPDVDMVYCDYEAIDDRGKPLVNSDFRVHNQKPKGSSFIHLPRSTEQLNLEKDNFIGGCFMYRGGVGKIIGEYDRFAFGCEDYDYWMRINSLFTIKHLGKDDILYRYRIHDDTLNARAKEFGIFEKVEKLMQYDKERRKFYEDKFDIFCVGSIFNRLEDFYRASENNVVHIRNIEDIKNHRLHKKCVIFTNEFLFGDSYQSLENDKDIFKIIIVDEDINEFFIDERAFKSCDWIITLTTNNFDILFSKYKDKLLYLPSYDKKNLNILLKLANNRIFYRLTRPAEKTIPPDIYLNRKLNILIETATLDKGGLEQVIFDIGTKIDKNLFNVYIVCIEKDGYIADKCREVGIQVFLINKNKKKYENLIQKLKIDFVNAHYSLFGPSIASKFGIPVVSVLHNNYVWLSESDKLEFKDADKHIKKYIAVSKNVSRYSRHYFGLSSRKIEIIPNGINIEAHERSPKKIKTRRDFDLDNEDYVFLNVAAYQGAKGHNLMITAMMDLIEKFPKMKIICVGQVMDSKYYNKIINEIKRKNLEKNIIFTGFIAHEELFCLYQMADAFLLPSLFEGWSVATMEAMLYGLPMILTDVGGSREIIEDNDIGIVIPNSYGDIINLNSSNFCKLYEEERPANTEDLKAAMIAFYENREKWEEAGKKGIEKVRMRYNLNNIVHQYEALFIKNIVYPNYDYERVRWNDTNASRIEEGKDNERLSILLDYPIKPTPRYGYGKPLHPILYEIIDRTSVTYKKYLRSFLSLKEYFLKIPVRNSKTPEEPCWFNGLLPGLDSVALYSFLYLNNPKRYFEIGSGFSTKFARRAILDHNLSTKITSIDPHPRAEIDSICDTVIRQPLEDVDLGVFDELEAGDILFVDGSHRCFMNSDVTVVFLDILPRLKSGVFVEFHDILLPYDYPPGWEEFYYSEQYLLAVYILAEGNRFNIVLPNTFISNDPELSHILNPLWDDPKMKGAERHGVSFWIETK